MLHAYVYYKVAPEDDLVALREQARALMHAMRGLCQSTLLQQRADQPGTWMEIYAGVANREVFDATMAQELANLSMPAPRAIEWFIDQPEG